MKLGMNNDPPLPKDVRILIPEPVNMLLYMVKGPLQIHFIQMGMM